MKYKNKRPKLNNTLYSLGVIISLNLFNWLLRKLLILVSKNTKLNSFLLRLNQMLYALFLSYHSITEAVLFARPSSYWVTTTGRLLGSKMGNSIKCLSQGHRDAHRESNQGFATSRLQTRRSRLQTRLQTEPRHRPELIT